MEEVMELMDKYEAVFGDSFPTMCFQTDSEKQLKSKIQECLDTRVSAEELFDLDYEDRLY